MRLNQFIVFGTIDNFPIRIGFQVNVYFFLMQFKKISTCVLFLSKIELKKIMMFCFEVLFPDPDILNQFVLLSPEGT